MHGVEAPKLSDKPCHKQFDMVTCQDQFYKLCLYAQSASLNLVDQSFLIMLTTLMRILLISRFVNSAWLFFWGSCGVETLCVTPYCCIRLEKGLLQKWDLSSLMIARRMPNLEKIFSLKKFKHHFVIIALACHYFYPLGDIIHFYQGVEIFKRMKEWIHKSRP